jgi:DNA helicase-2/ATP-dependent DNA helicase PcrA
MSDGNLTIQQLWHAAGFKPNAQQEQAILHVDGPLYLPAGPGSGKTRVLLWRALNLIVFHDVAPQDIYLSTFTEKAALQLSEGLRHYLGMVTHRAGQPYDISQMYVGTVHSLCRRLIQDRRFYPNRERARVPALMDALKQYFYLHRKRNWQALCDGFDLNGDPNHTINAYFEHPSRSRHLAVTNCIALFNRFSEECLDLRTARRRAADPLLKELIGMYERYLGWLEPDAEAGRFARQTDLSLLQQNALRVLEANASRASQVFRHVIIDEYQDTNTVQERIFFQLAAGGHNLCVVGDDDQALYRFRGATVENFVEFPDRCAERFGVAPTTIPLATNYRSRPGIVAFYTDFITHSDWRRPRGGHYRVMDKNIRAHRGDRGVSVVASRPAHPEDVCAEIAGLVRRLIDQGKVENPNQIAFLYPSLKSVQVRRMMAALEEQNLRVYAPRAGTFLDVEESIDMFGLFMRIFGKPATDFSGGQEFEKFCEWADKADARGKALVKGDATLARYVEHIRQEIAEAASDYQAVSAVIERHGWDLKGAYNLQTMKRSLSEAPGLSDRARRALVSSRFEAVAKARERDGRPFDLHYIVRRATALDWSVLDLFYRLSGFGRFQAMFDLAERGEDEGPVCNLALISRYLALFADEYVSVITANLLVDSTFRNLFFTSFLYALFRRDESEFEDAEDPFPKGRIPFLTIHQAKGLEFPVVVLGNPAKSNRGAQRVEVITQPLIGRRGEPLERIPEFDAMRMFYVALSRAQNLLVVAHYKGQGQSMFEPFRKMLDDDLPRIPELDLTTLPAVETRKEELPRNYSYTGDYLRYLRCPRQYMIFRKYDFAPSHSQTMMFGSLVHRTMDDLHQLLIAQRSQA